MSFLEKMKQQRLLSVTLLLATLAVGILIGTVLNRGVHADKQPPNVAADASPLVIPQATPITNEFSKLAKRLEPSVVYIESDYLPKAAPRGVRPPKDQTDDDSNSGSAEPNPQDPSDMLKKFFGKQADPQSYRREGSGTGFIVDRNGYIITNQHVVDKADRVKVKVNGDNAEYRAKIVGYDTETDVAVLKINTGNALTPVQVGNSDSVSVGDWAIAIGSPFGLEATVTAGIVSATSRDLPKAAAFQHFLQTDAAINPGNSGGPLLNIRGEVIGINTMIATRSGSYEGIGFALPSNMAVKVYNDIIRLGRVVRGSIGIQYSRDAAQVDTLRAFGLDHGVIVELVSQDGPAGKAGLRPDDIILALNDHPVRDGDDLVTKIADLPIGTNALLTVDRNTKRLDFTVPVQDRALVWKDKPQFAQDRIPEKPESHKPAQNGPQSEAKFGITIMRVTDRERRDLAIDDRTGVKVVDIESGSFADDIGMREGDVILSINRIPVSAPDDVVRIENTLKVGQSVAVHIVRSSGPGVKGTQVRLYISGRISQN